MNSKTKSDMTNPHYDIIGDIHGHYAPLARLLETLGYRQQEGVYQHARRKAIFLGDFIDRGPEQKQVLNTVRRMVDAGQAGAAGRVAETTFGEKYAPASGLSGCLS